jgi:gluconolactonase
MLRIGWLLSFCLTCPFTWGEPLPLEVERNDAAIDRLIPADAVLERVATGFQFIEGPVWRGTQGEGHLVFSDIPANRVYRWDPVSGEVSIEIEVVHDPDIVTGARGGSNGLLIDSQGRLVLFEHGMRRVARVDPNGTRHAIAERYEGKRLNSPNDGVFHSSGALFFTDPPYGLVSGDSDPNKEVPHNGIYRLDPDGTVTLVGRMHRPNGIGLSPDEKTLYVASSDMVQKFWMRFAVQNDLSLDAGEIFFDARDIAESGVPDGFAVDRAGNVWASGPGGLVVISPNGIHLGTVRTPEQPANVTFDADERHVFLTARTGLYRLRLR